MSLTLKHLAESSLVLNGVAEAMEDHLEQSVTLSGQLSGTVLSDSLSQWALGPLKGSFLVIWTFSCHLILLLLGLSQCLDLAILRGT